MERKFKRILYGGDYNPNQWPREIWDEDMRIFRDARINSATVNVFSWARLQPSEETYDFEQLDDIVDMLSREYYDIVLATSTASLPAWMVKNYPEVARTDYEGRQHKFGQRHNACPNSPIYRKYAEALAKPHLLVVLFCLRFFCAERGRFLIAADRKGVVYCSQRA